MKENVKLKLLPGIGCAQIFLNDEIENVIEELQLTKTTYEDKNIWGQPMVVYYNDELGLTIYDDDPEEVGIDTITCKRYLEFKGKNLIGMTIDALEAHVGLTHDDEIDRIDLDDGPDNLVYEFDPLGIQVWTYDDTNKVHTVIIGHIFGDDDEPIRFPRPVED